jgi:flagellar L-ring protein precursor FlgH
VAPKDIAREPHLTPVGSGIATERIPIPTLVPQSPRAGRNSTWTDRSADLFRDARAIRPGDILTVKISIKDKASLEGTSNRSRDSKMETQGKLAFGLEAFGLNKSGNGSLDASNNTNSSAEGRGAVSRSENIELMVAATVTEILGNGNLVITGSQEVRVNFEVRVLNVAGIVRPRDISTDNSVAYDRIAEARVSYGGRGRIMEVMQPRWGQQIIDNIAPF